MLERVQKRGIQAAGRGLFGVLSATWRFDVQGAEHVRRFRREGRPLIFVLWHSRLLPLLQLHRNEGVVALVSQHRDGEQIARILHRKGFGTARGSSTRGGVRGLRELVRVAREGHDLAVTPDGPRGPARKVKSGVLALARLGRLPLVPVSAGGPRVWRVGSWDRMVIPQPFARLRVRYAPPLELPRRAGEDELEAYRLRLEAELNRITDEVDGVARGEV